MICGDKYPIISDLEFSGLIVALTNLDVVAVIKKFKSILKNDPEFFQYILKIVPINFVCETNIEVIKQIVQQKYFEFLKPSESFKLKLKRRKNELIERDQFINVVTKNINNRVDLSHPDKIIRIEVLGNFSGISFVEKDDIIRTPKKTF
ncbi:MAG TPA: THUMP domain-containing protein [Candidatus Lokiarchaeia archaeon]